MERGSAQAVVGGAGHPFAPIVVNRDSLCARGPFRVVLLNARGGVRLDGIARCLARSPLSSASIILLCEADWQTARASGREVAAELAALLRMSFAYVPEFGIVRPGGAPTSFMGNAILSAEPFEDVAVAALPDEDRFRRRRR